MNIIPIAKNISNVYLRTNFKGNNNKFSSDSVSTPDESQSKQNNSAEFFMSTEQYLGMMGMGIASEALAEMKDPNSDSSKFQKAIMSSADNESGSEDDFGFAAQEAAEIALYTLKGAAKSMPQPPENLKGKIPVFISGGADEYIRLMEANISDMQNADCSQVQLPDLEDIYKVNPDFEKYGQLGEDMVAQILEAMQAYMTPEMMEEMANSQKAVIEVFKTTKHDELSETIASLNDSLNYMLYRALNAGFNRNPREVINTLTSDTMVYIKPEITDNGDGTSTYKYVNFSSVVSVVRNNKNGDFISVEAIKDGKKNFNIDFREDGSIEKMNYIVLSDNSEISFITNPQNNKLRSVQVFSDFACERIFNKQEDGTIKQTSVKIFTK